MSSLLFASSQFGALATLAGLASGAVLYAMLLAMTLRRDASRYQLGGLAVATGVLGLVWNLGSLAVYGAVDFGVERVPASVALVSFSALSWLPAVVVHSVLWPREGRPGAVVRGLVVAAYSLSVLTTALLVVDATAAPLPSPRAMRVQTFGYLLLIVPLIVVTRRESAWPRAGWLLALAVFAVSATHLAGHDGFTSPWYVEVVAHHASLPLAVSILYQDYRFALGDLFLKRALSLVGLSVAAFAGYALVIVPLLARTDLALEDPRTAGAIILVIVAVAGLYSPWHRLSGRIVDRLVLRRASARDVLAAVARAGEGATSLDAILDSSCAVLRRALSADTVQWAALEEVVANGTRPAGQAPPMDTELVTVSPAPGRVADVRIPTSDPPRLGLRIGRLHGGRRLFSDDTRLLESVALLLARRADAYRLATERLARELRDEEVAHLAVEAELRALRDQLNPHFLFNALTTIGYLIDTAPPRALDTLLRLTGLLRRVMSSDHHVTTLGGELEFVEAYLDIERARFEECLQVSIDVPEGLRTVPVPPFVVQPLVENAIKHAIAPNARGGRVDVRATVEGGDEGATLCLTVRDTGVGTSSDDLLQGRPHGVGLANLERRLQLTCGASAMLEVQTRPTTGTTVTVRLPMPPVERAGTSGDLPVAARRGGAVPTPSHEEPS